MRTIACFIVLCVLMGQLLAKGECTYLCDENGCTTASNLNLWMKDIIIKPEAADQLLIKGDKDGGVGIVFRRFHENHYHAGAVYVEQLQEYGPPVLLESQMVERGDILYEVDGVNSYRRSTEWIHGKIRGPVGSWVSLVLKRPADNGSGEAIEALPAISITVQRRDEPVEVMILGDETVLWRKSKDLAPLDPFYEDVNAPSLLQVGEDVNASSLDVRHSQKSVWYLVQRPRLANTWKCRGY
jgi:hypothetical protein